MIEFIIGAVVGFVIGALVYRNNAEKWKEQSEILEAKFDAEVENSMKEIKELTDKLNAKTKKKK